MPPNTGVLEKRSIVKKIDWQLKPPISIKEKVFSADELINAYLVGINKGYTAAKIEHENKENEQNSINIKTFSENIDKAKTICEKFYSEINDAFSALIVWLRPYSIINFDAIYIVKKKDFLKDEFLDIYSKGQKIRKNENNSSFNISFSFMPYTPHLNEKKLLADGYVLNYGNTFKSKSRKA